MIRSPTPGRSCVPRTTTITLTGANVSFLPEDNGAHSVSLTVSDDDGGPTTRRRLTCRPNVAPTINTFTVPTTGTEGTALNLSAAATDPAGNFDLLDYTWTITRPDGSTATLVGKNTAFTPTDNGIHAVSLTVADGDGGTAVRTGSIAVTNVIPMPELGTGGGSALQAVPVSPIAPPRLPSPLFSGVLMASDPSSADEAAGFEYRVDWGDSSAFQTFARTAGNGDGICREPPIRQRRHVHDSPRCDR